MGKTQLAADHAHRAWEQGWVELLVWVGATSREAVVGAYARLAADLSGRAEPDAEQGARRLLDWLATTGCRWLVVLDDVQAPAELAGLWPPRAAAGCTLVTTRRRDAALARVGQVVGVGVFTPAESAAYLHTVLAAHPHLLEGAGELAQALGHLPLALSQAAAYLVDRGLTCAEYLDRFRARRLVEVLPEPDALPDEHRATVAATWSLSIEAADRLAPIGLASPLLRLCALLDPPASPGRAHRRTGPGPPRPGHRRPGRHRAGPRRAGVSALVQPDHPRCAAPAPGGAGARPGPTRHPRPHPRPRPAAAGPHRRRRPAEHLARHRARHHPGRRAARQHPHSAPPHGEHLWHPDTHPVLFRNGRSLGEAGQPGAARDHFAHLHTTATHLLGPDHPDTLAIRNNLAFWRGETGDAAGAAAMFAELLEDRLRVLGPDHPNPLATRQNLAYWRRIVGGQDVDGSV